MEYLIVDVDSRIIKIPEEITHLGVKDDNETRTLKFQMPKVYKGLDLSDYSLEINFINANNKSDSALTENKQIDGDNITFEWCVGKSAYAKNGKVNFLVYAYLENEYGIKTNEWHTTWAKLDVLDGGNVNGAIAEENPRIIDEMLRRIRELENGKTGGTADAVQYIAQTLTEEQQTQARANIGAASSAEVSKLSEEIDDLQSELETEVENQIDGAKADIVLEVLAQMDGGTGSVFGKVNDDGTITLTTDLADGEYALMYENEDGSLTEIGEIIVSRVQVYSITRTLNGCTSNKSATSIQGGSSWTETLTEMSGRTFSSVTVKMGGVDVTSSVYSNGVINIANVTGDIVITATALLPNYTNLANPSSSDWLINKRVNSSRVIVDAGSNNQIITNFMSIGGNNKFHVKGMNLLDALVNGDNYSRAVFCDDNNTILGTINLEASPQYYSVAEYDENVIIVDVASAIAYISTLKTTTKVRFGGYTTTPNDVIITRDEEIK